MGYFIDLPSWITKPDSWMKPTLGNVKLPGIVYLKECGLSLRHQKSKKSGADYGTILIQGLEMPDFEFELLLFTKEDEDGWNSVSPLFLPRKQPENRDLLPVYHPILASYQITTCTVLKLRTKMPNSGGAMTVNIGCIAVSPSKNNATKTLKSTGLGGKGPGANYKSPEALNFSTNLPSRKEQGKSAPKGNLR